MMQAASRKKVWVDRSASLVVLVGAAFFFSALLDAASPTASRVLGLPIQLVGSVGLALLTVGLGALAVTGCRLAFKRSSADRDQLQGLVEQHLPTVGQVLIGAVLTLFYFFART
jgi:ABC-type nickel/cobalt efflux system permease component RcnA